MGDDANAPESSACVENCTASSVGTGLALGRYAASAGSGMGQPRDSKWVAKWLQGVRPLYRPAPTHTPPIRGIMSTVATLASPQKITFAEMRESGARGLLVYCGDYR